MSFSLSYINNLIVALADKRAGTELAAAIQNGSMLSAYTFARLVDAMGSKVAAQNFQNSILGLQPLTQKDIAIMGSAFTSKAVAQTTASSVAGGYLPPAAPGTNPAPIPPVVTPQVALPTFSPVAGTYVGAQLIALSSATAGAALYYTTDGSTPTTGSTLYTTPISVTSSETIKVLGVKASFTNSAIASAAYVLSGVTQVATPTFSPVAGSYSGTQSITISTITAGSTIYYTTDGSTPTRLSSLYSGPVSVAVSETLKALAIHSSDADSAIASAAYVIGALGPAAVNLASAATYRILSEAGISTTAGTAITGNIGVSPIAHTAITGFTYTPNLAGLHGSATEVSGFIDTPDNASPTPANVGTAVSDMQAAYTDAAGRSTSRIVNTGGGNLGGLSLVPGLYQWTTGVTIPSALTLNGGPSDVYIMQVNGTLDLSTSIAITLAGGLLPQNIFWQVTGAVTLHVSSVFQGIILGQTSIAVQTTATVHGRLYAQTAVTLDDDVIAA